jgi:hypothetical protein
MYDQAHWMHEYVLGVGLCSGDVHWLVVIPLFWATFGEASLCNAHSNLTMLRSPQVIELAFVSSCPFD